MSWPARPGVIEYRPFRNTDPPRLAEVWRSLGSVRPGLMQPMSTAVLEHFVLAKPYFEPAGLIVATDDDAPIGFAHAGFGPNEDESELSTELGVTCQIVLGSAENQAEISGELLVRCEGFLRGRGAKVLYGGSLRPLNPFYLGLYGGSELPGVLDSDQATQAVFRNHNYREIDRAVLFERELLGFRPPVDRTQMLIRRSTSVAIVPDPPARTWWEACTLSGFDRLRFELSDRSGHELAQATFRTMEPMSAGWGVPTMGLVELEVHTERRRQGLATYVLGESFRALQAQGIARVQVQTMRRNTAARALYAKLGFEQIDEGAVFRKE
jgi:ribosomal protein S18 acetylase RimI-like enzyme